MTIDQLIETIKQSSQHRYLYHFTDEVNFPSIRQKGLVSKERMRAEGWWPPLATGGNALSQELDAYRGVSRYVSLCFTRGHPMLYHAKREGRLPNPWYLGISPEVLRIEGTLVCFGVANANDATWLTVAEAAKQLDAEVIYRRTNWSDPAVQQRLQAARKFEILVPNEVPRKLIEVMFDG